MAWSTAAASDALVGHDPSAAGDDDVVGRAHPGHDALDHLAGEFVVESPRIDQLLYPGDIGGR